MGPCATGSAETRPTAASGLIGRAPTVLEENRRPRRENAEPLEMIVKIRTAHEFAGTYGSPRVWLELRRQGMPVGRKRVERIMREAGRQGAFLRKGWKGGSTKQNPRHTAAPDLVDRDFTATVPNRLWAADRTGS